MYAPNVESSANVQQPDLPPKKRIIGKPFQKGQSGNPLGKPKGTLDFPSSVKSAFRRAQASAEDIITKAIEMALAGDVVCMKIILDRIMPVPKEASIETINKIFFVQPDDRQTVLRISERFKEMECSKDITPSSPI
jgi:hypothetical protein